MEQEADHRGRSPADSAKRIAIIAESSLLIEAIKLGLRADGGFEVLGRVDGDQAGLEAVLRAQPDVVLVDDMLRTPDALDVITAVRSASDRSLIFLLSIRADAALLDAACTVGATAVISKSISPASVGTVVRETARGRLLHLGSRLDSPLTHRRLRSSSTVGSHLTTRELEILRLMAAGRTNGQIAEKLLVTEQTVKFHVANVLRKLRVRNRTQASHYAHLHGLVAREGAAIPQEGAV